MPKLINILKNIKTLVVLRNYVSDKKDNTYNTKYITEDIIEEAYALIIVNSDLSLY